MKINNLKLETDNSDILVPIKTQLVVEQVYPSNTINIKKQVKEKSIKKEEEITGFGEILKEEMDKYK